MKKIILLSLFTLSVLNGSAQLKMIGAGKVSIGTTEGARSTLSVGGAGETGYGASIFSANTGVLYLRADTAKYASPSLGIKALFHSKAPSFKGIYIQSNGLNAKSDVYGINSLVNGNTCYGVFGGIRFAEKSLRAVGVYGSSRPFVDNIINGVYAGFFHGDVRVTGSIYGTVLSPTTSSSSSSVGDMASVMGIGDSDASVVDKLQKVDLLQMKRVNKDGSIAANKLINKGGLKADNQSTATLQDMIGAEAEEQEGEDAIQTQLSAISYGLAADQLKEVYPELVYEDADGNYSVNYIEMVPLLVQSIKELSAKVVTLEQRLGIDTPTKPILRARGKVEESDNVLLTIPDNAQEATLNIYAPNGKLVRTTSVNVSDVTSLSAYTRGLPTGTYIYALTVDGRKQKARKVLVP